jgi:predicted nucleic acid-binding protein
MKTLIDSCVWSLVLRRRDPAVLNDDERQAASSLTQAIRDHRVAIAGPIRQEILSGVKDQAQFEKLREHLAAFPDEAITTADYEEAARLSNLCRSQGLQSGPVDILLCAIAQQRKWTILTVDRGLMACLRLITISTPQS